MGGPFAIWVTSSDKKYKPPSFIFFIETKYVGALTSLPQHQQSLSWARGCFAPILQRIPRQPGSNHSNGDSIECKGWVDHGGALAIHLARWQVDNFARTRPALHRGKCIRENRSLGFLWVTIAFDAIQIVRGDFRSLGKLQSGPEGPVLREKVSILH